MLSVPSTLTLVCFARSPITAPSILYLSIFLSSPPPSYSEFKLQRDGEAMSNASVPDVAEIVDACELIENARTLH